MALATTFPQQKEQVEAAAAAAAEEEEEEAEGGRRRSRRRRQGITQEFTVLALFQMNTEAAPMILKLK